MVYIHDIFCLNHRLIELSNPRIIILMQIKINGESRAFDAPLSVQALTLALAFNPRQVAIERNREIVPRSLYADVMLGEGDEIEIVTFIGGG